MKNVPYIGNAAYCYSDCTAMLLSSVGENVPSSKIEVLMGLGLSASLGKGGFQKEGLLWFHHSNLLPDLGIGKALEILGFSYKSKVTQSPEDIPFEDLREDLEKSPAILGPLEECYLTYNPHCQYLLGVDHSILAYEMDDEKIYLHDPKGFPYVSLPLEQLQKSWRAERIFYRRGYYRYITAPKRIKNPTEEEIYNSALNYFRTIYLESESEKSDNLIGSEAILACAKKVKNDQVSEEEIGHFIRFALPTGAKRALDFVSFSGFHDNDLATLKQRQAELFGAAQTAATAKNWSSLAGILQELGKVEETFREKLLEKASF